MSIELEAPVVVECERVISDAFGGMPIDEALARVEEKNGRSVRAVAEAYVMGIAVEVIADKHGLSPSAIMDIVEYAEMDVVEDAAMGDAIPKPARRAKQKSGKQKVISPEVNERVDVESPTSSPRVSDPVSMIGTLAAQKIAAEGDDTLPGGWRNKAYCVNLDDPNQFDVNNLTHFDEFYDTDRSTRLTPYEKKLERTRQENVIKDFCMKCTVRKECRDAAIEEGDLFTIRGGTTPDERKNMNTAASA